MQALCSKQAMQKVATKVPEKKIVSNGPCEEGDGEDGASEGGARLRGLLLRVVEPPLRSSIVRCSSAAGLTAPAPPGLLCSACSVGRNLPTRV